VNVQRVTPELDRLRLGGFQAYLWYDDDSRDATLIDTGPVGYGPDILDALHRRGRRPSHLRRIVLTHFHDDHVGSAAELRAWTGAQVVAHAADAAIIRGQAPGPTPDFLQVDRDLHARATDALPPAPPVEVDLELGDGDVLDFGGRARVISVPGHTDGSIALHLPSRRVLFTGDVIAEHRGRVVPGGFDLDTAQAHRAFGVLAALDVDVACFGHGDPLTRAAGDTLRSVEVTRDQRSPDAPHPDPRAD
jgi:glyoxylase-like metal-dependent hydrolase (beta-lactamase superfamily II)